MKSLKVNCKHELLNQFSLHVVAHLLSTWRSPVLAFLSSCNYASSVCVCTFFPKVFSDHSQPHHDHLLPWQLSHRTNRPPLSLSLSFSFTSCLSSAGLHFLCRDSYSPISHCHHFNFLTEDSTFFVYLIFFLPSLVSFLCFFCSWDTFSCGKISRISSC